MQETSETQVQSLGQEDPLEKDITTHSSILAGESHGQAEPGRPQSIRLQTVRYDRSNLAHPPSFSPKRAKALQTPRACLPQSSLPVCLAFKGRRRGPTGARVPGPLSLWVRRVGPAVRPGRERLHPAGGPAEAWGPEGMGKRAPFFPAPAILRLRFSLGARVANHAALGARLVAGSGDERLGAPRTSSPECSGSAQRDPHLHFQGLELRSDQISRSVVSDSLSDLGGI